MFIINRMSTKEQKDKLLQTFHALDLDHDGKLSEEELLLGIQMLY